MATPERPATPPPERPTDCVPDRVPSHFLAEPAGVHMAPVLRELARLGAAGAEPEALPRALQAALGGRYTIERVLGTGGMAIVYLARDERNERPVALKVVRPGVVHPLAAHRFVREARTVARLTHPHIVSLHDSDEADGIPFYVMAYVEGESLRARLRRDGRLPVADAVRIAREVADALDYAHRHGVVHRDVKPENVLFQDGHALVADFGIAHLMRGLRDGDASATADETLTATGVVVGTIAYMSPEQASGAPDIDGRSDVYSLGCVLFEMLAGRPPFVGAELDVVGQHRDSVLPALPPDVPAGIAKALQRALAKQPAERFATAAEFAAALSSSSEPKPRHATRRAVLLPALLAAAAIGGTAIWRLGVGRGDAAVEPGARILVADIAGPASDSTLGYVVSQALLTDLGQSTRIRIVTAGEMRETLARMRRDSVRRLDPSLAREVAQREGIAAVLEGEVQQLPDAGYQLVARLVSADSGRVLVQVRRTARNADALIPALDRLSDDLRAAIGDAWMVRRASPPLAQVTTASFEALRKYTQGVRAWRIEGSASRGAALLEEAIAIDTGFAMAYLALGGMPAQRGHVRSFTFAMKRNAFAYRHRLTDRERLLVTGDYFSYGGFDFQPERASAAYEALIKLGPTGELDGLNNAGLLREHMGDLRGAIDYFTRLLALDSSAAAVVHSNLVRAQLGLGRVEEARATLIGMSRRVPNHPRYFEARSWIAFSTGEYDSVRTQMRALADAHPAEPSARATALTMLFSAALVNGRVREALETAQVISADARRRKNSPAALIFDLHSARVRASLLGDSAAARDSSRIAVARTQFPADIAEDDAPHLTYARTCAFIGDFTCSQRFIRRFEERRRWEIANGYPADGFSVQAHHLAVGAIALNQARYRDARAEFLAAAGTHYCVICADAQLGDAFLALGERDSARVAYERYVTTPFGRRDRFDPWLLPRALRRLGELYEDRDPAKAAHYYARFIDLWKDADPVLQPQVSEARRRLARLQSGTR